MFVDVDDKRLRAMCEALPLKQTDRQIAYGLAVLCLRSGAYAPEHGKGQAEIARLAGCSVRTVQRRLKYLVNYEILTIRHENGRANVYQFDMLMLFDCPRPRFDVYQDRRPPKEPPRKSTPPPADYLPLFDQQTTPPAAPAIEGPTVLERITRAAGCLLSGLFRKGAEQTAATAVETAATSTGAETEPPPVTEKPTPPAADSTKNRRQSVGERNATAATFQKTTAIPAETPAISAGSDPEPPPTAAKTPANSALHIHSTFHNKTHLKTSIIHTHGNGDGNLDFDSEGGQVGAGEAGTPPPPGVRKVSWGREVRERDLSDPLALQELYLVAVDQGFFLEIDTARLNFFALAHYCRRAKKVANKLGLFSSNVDRTVRDKFNQPFEKKLSQADEEWARKAIKQIDYPALKSKTERMQQA